MISDDVRGNRDQLTCLNSLDIRSEIWRRSLKQKIYRFQVLKLYLPGFLLEVANDCLMFLNTSPSLKLGGGDGRSTENEKLHLAFLSNFA